MRRRSQPMTCEIRWSPGERGRRVPRHHARRRRGGVDRGAVAALRAPLAGAAGVRRRVPRRVRRAVAATSTPTAGMPYERGREWWAMRLRRDASPELDPCARWLSAPRPGTLVRGGAAVAAGAAALAVWPRTTRVGALGQAGRRDPALRADRRGPPGGVLRRRDQARRPERRAARVRPDRRRPRARARRRTSARPWAPAHPGRAPLRLRRHERRRPSASAAPRSSSRTSGWRPTTVRPRA